MTASEHHRRNRRPRARRGAVVGDTDDEETLFGDERVEDVRKDELVELRQVRRVQNWSLVGFLLLCSEVMVLGTLSMVGVGLGWFDTGFAAQALLITIPPSFTGWLLVARYAFRRCRPAGRSSSPRR